MPAAAKEIYLPPSSFSCAFLFAELYACEGEKKEKEREGAACVMYSEFNECEYESECRQARGGTEREGKEGEKKRRVTIEMWVSQTLPSLDC